MVLAVFGTTAAATAAATNRRRCRLPFAIVIMVSGVACDSVASSCQFACVVVTWVCGKCQCMSAGIHTCARIGRAHLSYEARGREWCRAAQTGSDGPPERRWGAIRHHA